MASSSERQSRMKQNQQQELLRQMRLNMTPQHLKLLRNVQNEGMTMNMKQGNLAGAALANNRNAQKTPNGLPGQQIPGNNAAAEQMLAASGINPNNLNRQQFQNFASARPTAQQKSIPSYVQNPQQEHNRPMGGNGQIPTTTSLSSLILSSDGIGFNYPDGIVGRSSLSTSDSTITLGWGALPSPTDKYVPYTRYFPPTNISNGLHRLYGGSLRKKRTQRTITELRNKETISKDNTGGDTARRIELLERTGGKVLKTSHMSRHVVTRNKAKSDPILRPFNSISEASVDVFK